MASRPLIGPKKVIDDGDMSGDITSDVTILTNLSMISYSFSWSGSSPSGSILIQVSNDYRVNADGSVRDAGTWNTVPLDEEAAVSGNSGTGFVEIVTSAYAIRAFYDRTSGTGTLQADIKGKVM